MSGREEVEDVQGRAIQDDKDDLLIIKPGSTKQKQEKQRG